MPTQLKKSKSVSRLDFLKSSGLMTAGLTFVPGFLSSMILNKEHGLAAHTAAIDLKLILPKQADAIEHQAAELLKQHLQQIPGLVISISPEDASASQSAIYLGQTDFAKARKINFSEIKEGGYFYKALGSDLIIAGGPKKGLLNGVYDLLEAMGFRKYAPDYTQIPTKYTPVFPAGEKAVSPQISYRTTSYGAMGGEDFTDWHKLSSRADWGLFVHTFNTLVPAKEYGKTHPEYYSLIKGIRSPGTQLCLSNPEVLQVLIGSLRKKIAEKPAASYWSVSQDDNDQYCSCDSCKALNERYGDVPSGSILHFVNQVAQAFPDKKISTLAYWYSRKAPQNIKAEPNVNIMLCNIESSREAPVYVTDPAFSNDLKDWGALSNDILIWDYNIQFTNFISPFPNLFTIKPNIRFYTDNNVRALFMQANNEPAAELALLRSYLISKLMWDPGLDEDSVINEFMTGYYGAAGPYIRQYIDAMQEALVKSKFKLSIFGDPIDAKESYLSAAMMSSYKTLFDQAENAVKTEPQLLERVQVARLPLMYAAVQIGRTEIDTPRSMYSRDTNGIVTARPGMKALVSQFVELCKKKDVKLIRERSGSPDHFLASYTRIFNKMAETPGVKSFGKKISPITQPAGKSKGVEALTDGIFASYESWQQADQNWVYYTGEHMDFILDLGELMPLNSINMDFLNPQAQPDWHLFSLPAFVTYSWSGEGKSFTEPIRIDNPHKPDPGQNPEISKISFYGFKASPPAGTKARYIKVHGESLLKMPSWHIRSGAPASIYTDQIVVT
jgi:hypothetical protein